jgi:hypothetical protein
LCELEIGLALAFSASSAASAFGRMQKNTNDEADDHNQADEWSQTKKASANREI